MEKQYDTINVNGSEKVKDAELYHNENITGMNNGSAVRDDLDENDAYDIGELYIFIHRLVYLLIFFAWSCVV